MERFGETPGDADKNYADIRHAKIGLEQGVYNQGLEFHAQIGEDCRTNPAHQERGFPSELNQNPNRQKPRDRHALVFVLLLEIVQDQDEVPHEKHPSHETVIGRGGSLNSHQRLIRANAGGNQGAGEPPGQYQKAPFQQVWVFLHPQPNPAEVSESVGHGHPQQDPEHAVFRADGPRMQHQVEDAKVDKEIHETENNSDGQRHVFLL